jgi:hypothetical protein
MFSRPENPGSVLRLRAFLPAALAVVSCACASQDPYLISPGFSSGSGGLIALLPFENYSNDVSAPALIRDEVSKRFASRGYSVLSTDGTDEKLRGIGITDGGQLSPLTPAEIGKTVDAELLCYGTIEDFTFQNLGFVVRKVVKIRLKIVSAASGETLFEASGRGRDVKVFLNKEDATGAFVVYTAQKMVQNMLRHPLRAESETALNAVFRGLPRR